MNITTVGKLLKQNRFYKNHIYRISDTFGDKNYDYIGREGAIIIMRPCRTSQTDANDVNLNLYSKDIKVKVIKL